MRTTIIVLGLLVLVAVVVAKQISGKNRAKKLKAEVTANRTNQQDKRRWSYADFKGSLYCDQIDPMKEGIVFDIEKADYPTNCGTRYNKKRFLDILKKTEELKEDERIVGGVEAGVLDWPWLVAIGRKGDGQDCGAILIHEQFVLTAAHCLHSQHELPCFWNIRIGEHNLHVDEGLHEDRTAENMFIHPGYNKYTLENDVAIIQLDQPVDTQYIATPICMPTDVNNVDKQNCYVAGWGKTSHGGSGSDTVKHLGVQVFDDEFCSELYGEQDFLPGMLCAGTPEGGEDVCHGDSGGPLSCYDHLAKHWVVIGVVSWGYTCAAIGYPGVYSSVEYYMDWINGVIDINAI